MRMRVQSLASLSGLRIWRCCELGVGCGSDPALLWLWYWPVATAPIGPLAWEPPYAARVALAKAKRQKKKKKRLLQCLGYCKQCCSECRDACIFVNYSFFWTCVQSGMAGWRGSSMFRLLRNRWYRRSPFSLHSLRHLLFVIRTFKIRSVSHLQMCDAVLLTMIAMLYIRFPFFLLFRATPAAYGCSQVKGPISSKSLYFP